MTLGESCDMQTAYVTKPTMCDGGDHKNKTNHRATEITEKDTLRPKPS
jgi:hypothetical protein